MPALAASPATVTGTVRDAAGIQQIGVLVQLLSANHAVQAAAYTDANGNFKIEALNPGVFELRASSAMYMPAMAENIALKLGTHAVVNLTLNTLTEALQWLPAHPRTASEPADDWKWTLRSPANRPILRMLDDGVSAAATVPTEPGRRLNQSVHASAVVMSRSAEFGASGTHQVITLEHAGRHESDFLFNADLVPSNTQMGSATAVMSQHMALGQTFKMAANFQWHSNLIGGGSSSLDAAIARASETMDLGPGVTAEVGSEMEQVSWGQHVSAMHPFAIFSFAPTETASLSYSFSTTPGFESADDTDTTIGRTPLAAPTATGLVLEHGLHQEIAYARHDGPTMVSIAYFHDSVDDPILQGLGTAQAVQNEKLVAGVDPVSGIFRMAGASYASQGIKASMEHQFGAVNACLTLIDAGAMKFVDSGADQSPITHMGNAQLASLTLRGMVPATHTKLVASYGIESEGVLVPIEAFNLDGPSPYMSIVIRQPIHWHNGTNNLEALIDVRNLLAEGYHPFVSPDGETLYLVQVPRSIQGGFAFSF
jgi:hypothetical protein